MDKSFPISEAVPNLEIPQDADASPPHAAEVDTHTKPRKRLLRVFLFAVVAVAALIGGAHSGWHYWTVGRFLVSTDDAYVKADSTTIAPKVSGYIAAVLVGDNEAVKDGQILARIDDRDFVVSLEQAKAHVQAAEADIVSKQAALAAQLSQIEAARATIAVDQASETFAKQEDQRHAELAKKGFGSIQNAQLAASQIAAARAAVNRDTAVLANATSELDVLNAELGQVRAALASARTDQDQAELNLSYTEITAPIAGTIGNRTLRIGQFVQAGTQLMAVVPTGAAYIVANYKETQLANVEPGQPVDIEVDTFPGQVIRGHIDSVSPSSGQEFALLPPDNATGNFTKVVQRIPVKIVLDRGLLVELRPGMSVYPTINTKPSAAEFASASGPIN
ncbi:HlyD family secretion protein [Mesorhizobium erdmanii]|uniref:HlyD family secretion protein n=1 Tax=Mesorhizobium erdmanii TaxID=1777866 RepID=UPI00041E1449|nr:HlyD family secretion protein [Mesorhizobium erdmanii]